MKPKLKINFTDFWPGFKRDDNFFYHLLAKLYDLELTDKPDFLFYSCFGEEYSTYDCLRILYTGENIKPEWGECDFAFSYDDQSYGGRNYRLPLYALSPDLSALTAPKPSWGDLKSQKTKFCNMVVSNDASPTRINFFQQLSKYKPVDSGGRYLNNVGGPVKDKIEFMRPYKFTIAFENESSPGYTTEKIFEAMRCHSIPIYWGNPRIARDFNSKSFINCHEYKNFAAVIDRVIAVDTKDELYHDYWAEPYFPNNTINDDADANNILAQFQYIFSLKGKVVPCAQRLGWSQRNFIRAKRMGRRTYKRMSRLVGYFQQRTKHYLQNPADIKRVVHKIMH